MYGYWYKFLRLAELDPNRTVDWSQYDGWGGSETILTTPFRRWWLERWQDLFGVSDPADKSKFSMSTDRTKPVAVKVALRVYENRHKQSYVDIFYDLHARYPKSDMGSISARSETAWDTKEVNRSIKRYMEQAEKILDHVCEGKFP